MAVIAFFLCEEHDHFGAIDTVMASSRYPINADWQDYGRVQLKRDDIRAALAFAKEMTRERIIPIPTEPVSA